MIWIIKICVIAVRINVIIPAVNAGRQVLREIRAPWAPRESKAIWDVPDQKATGEIRALWAPREFPALPEQEVPGETQGL